MTKTTDQTESELAQREREIEIEMERFAAVTAATGALGPVLVKLTALLGDEFKLQEGTRRDIMSIKSELEPVHALLLTLWERMDLDVACKDWMMEARELSYSMDDGIDRFIALGLDHGLMQREETTGGPFMDFMESVKGVSERRHRMKTATAGYAICDGSKVSIDPRALFLHRDASELVGMEEKEELVKFAARAGNGMHRWICRDGENHSCGPGVSHHRRSIPTPGVHLGASKS